MAEIEFKRRGTPLWVVVVALLVIAGIVWAVVGRGGGSAPATADSAPPAAAPAAGPAAMPPPANSAATAPAAAAGPVTKFVAWVDSATPSPEPAAERAAIATGLRLLADALQERMPMAGTQIVLTRAMADSLMLPNPTANQATNATQAAFFAVAYAMRSTPPGERMNQMAAAIQLTKPLAQQRTEVGRFFETARDAMQDPSKTLKPVDAPGARRRAPAPGDSAARAQAPATKAPTP